MFDIIKTNPHRRNRVHELALRVDCCRCDGFGHRINYGACISLRRRSNGDGSAGHPHSRPDAHTCAHLWADARANTRTHAGPHACPHTWANPCADTATNAGTNSRTDSGACAGFPTTNCRSRESPAGRRNGPGLHPARCRRFPGLPLRHSCGKRCCCPRLLSRILLSGLPVAAR